MNWHYKAPTEVGFYWYQESPSNDLEVVEIYEHDGQLRACNLFASAPSILIPGCLPGRWSDRISQPDQSAGWDRSNKS